MVNLRNYFTFRLQQKFKVHPTAILNILKIDNPDFFGNGLKEFQNKLSKNINLLNQTAIVVNCPTGLLFNPNLLLCDFPENVNGGVSYYCMDDETGIISECDEDSWSAPDCKIDNNLSLTAGTFIGKCFQASIWSRFPEGLTGTFKDKLLSEIKANNSSSNDYKTAWKLLNRKDYRK